MSRIKILPELLSNKIAAGEVIERPASVVKELLENGLDAGGSKIIIEVKHGGRSLIRVSDDGSGMGHDDALLALERYATSKIYKDEDLFSIATLGFRGEALPSIAAVSKFLLVSADAHDSAGTEIVVQGGKIKNVKQIGAPRGTMITVKDLFFNTPARRKFLKTTATEMGHIVETVTRISLGWPEVAFQLIHNGKVLKKLSPVKQPFDRVLDVLGRENKNRLHEIGFENHDLSVSGWISSPQVMRSTSRGIYIYVNGRFVRDRVIHHALVEGYRGRLMPGRFPMGVLQLVMPPDEVDVNVHPTKNEVRFVHHRRVHDRIAEAVSRVLASAERFPWQSKRATTGDQSRVAELVSGYHELNKDAVRTLTGKYNPTHVPKIKKHVALETFDQKGLWLSGRLKDLRLIGQFHRTYILCESDEGLLLVDQHAAHERIIFEQMKTRAASGAGGAQRLLMPETIDLGYREAKILDQLLPDLGTLQLEIEPFGGNTFVIKSIPAILKNRDVKPMIIEMVERIAESGFSPGLEKTIDTCLMLMACHGAIRANQTLSDQEMTHLLDQLQTCHNPDHCPHGRPTFIKYSVKSLEKSFRRIV